MKQKEGIMPQTANINPAIRDFLLNHSDWWGSKVVFLLQSKPDEPIHVIRLSHMIEPPEFPAQQYESFTRIYESCCGIPQTDTRTIKEIDKCLEKLIIKKAALVANNLDFTHLEAEMQSLIKYRKETTKPNGKIKKFRQETFKELQRHRKAFIRLLDQALIECPEAYYHFKAHVQTGQFYTWISFPDEIPVSLKKKKQREQKKKRKTRYRTIRRC